MWIRVCMVFISLLCFISSIHGVERGYRTQADKQIEIEKEVSRKQSIIHLNMAEEIEKEGNLLRALEMYENFLILYESSEYTFDACNKIASIFQKINNLPQAIDAYKKAYRIAYNQEKGLQAYLNAGRLYREIGEYKTARDIFNEISDKGAFTRISRLATLELSSLAFLSDAGANNGKADKKETEKVNSEQLPTQPPL